MWTVSDTISCTSITSAVIKVKTAAELYTYILCTRILNKSRAFNKGIYIYVGIYLYGNGFTNM